MRLFGFTLARTRALNVDTCEKIRDAYHLGYQSGKAMQECITELQNLRAPETKPARTRSKRKKT